ncbi:MAG: dihydrodipicolinate synthase family protein, partial [Methylobacteriaceae bacterium]|nr:dihydrodipicolinate synthase family protein [Methylobacteriaceae bacterium]
WNCAEALLAGADAWYSVIGGVLPGPAAAITRAARAGDAAEARRLDARLAPLWALFRELSSLRVVYAIAEILGLAHASPPLPIRPLSPEARARVAAALAAPDLN